MLISCIGVNFLQFIAVIGKKFKYSYFFYLHPNTNVPFYICFKLQNFDNVFLAYFYFKIIKYIFSWVTRKIIANLEIKQTESLMVKEGMHIKKII